MMGKHSSIYHFDENLVQDLNEDQCNFFEYDKVEDDHIVDYDPTEVQKLGEILRELLVWLSMGDLNCPRYKDTVLRKVIAMCWVLRPELYNGLALADICKKKGVNMHRQSLSKQAINFSKRFNIKGRGQRKRHECS